MSTITVRGNVITTQQITGFKTSATHSADNLAIWANACAVQSYGGNHNWSNDLFSLPTMRLQSGKLSVHGKNVLAYIKAHAPRFHFNSDKGKVVLTGSDAKDGKAFVATGTKTPLLNNDGAPTTDFPLSFVEFLNWAKPKAEPKVPAIKAAPLGAMLEKIGKALESKTLVTGVEEVAIISAQLRAVYLAFEELEARLLAREIPVDMVKAFELLKSGQEGKSKRAGDKVADAV